MFFRTSFVFLTSFFSLTLLPGASAQTVITVLQGNGQLVPSNLGLSSAPILLQVTTNGVPVPNATLNIFSSNGPNLPPLTSLNPVTDANGIASVQLVPGLQTQSTNLITYDFVASYNGASASFIETSYFVGGNLLPGVNFQRIAPDYSQLAPYQALAGQGSATIVVQAIAQDTFQGIPNVGVKIVPVRTNVVVPPNTPVEQGYCREGVGPEHIVYTDNNGYASCTPIFLLPNSALNPAYDTMTFQLEVGGFNSFGPFYYSILPAPLVFQAPAFPPATVNQSFQAQLNATGGTPPYTFSVPSGSALPPGLTLNSAGMISGFPTMARLYTFNLQVTDSQNMTVVAPAALSVSGGPIVVTPPSGGLVQAGSLFDQFVRISGGVPPYASLLPIGLPAGFTVTSTDPLNDTYEIKGTVTRYERRHGDICSNRRCREQSNVTATYAYRRPATLIFDEHTSVRRRWLLLQSTDYGERRSSLVHLFASAGYIASRRAYVELYWDSYRHADTARSLHGGRSGDGLPKSGNHAHADDPSLVGTFELPDSELPAGGDQQYSLHDKPRAHRWCASIYVQLHQLTVGCHSEPVRVPSA